ncbi:RagB/SusD family nutrient uptake outer membrane protein [Chitinophaga arvensicola]|uniref:SusD family protein n=1 Tax=Chitinophaga arvensicola TaxID=29529 RepID=A0A1I0NE60_9BACT|nr:RagB/SusD family nutrient uptake outer membrane protein [Chitinophaga arvensicola]SEV99393.1 SusD family protein [Chitinophaga arvensicola]
MKRLIHFILCGLVITGTVSCKKYLEIVPKGQKIPQTFEDYQALVESSDAHVFDYDKQNMIANDFYLLASAQITVNLSSINFNWKEASDRVQYTVDDGGYNAAYKGIFVYNVLVNNVKNATTGTQADKDRLIAQAKVGRSMLYFYLITSYAKMYDPATAATDPGVFLNTSDNMEATMKQVSVKEMYDFILNDLNEALPFLPEKPVDAFFAGKGAGYALLSRVHLFMKDYASAATFAEEALKQNSALFDYVNYYNENKVLADGSATSINIPRYEFKNPENYNFNYGSQYMRSQGMYLSMLRNSDSTQYDKGDARLKVNYVNVMFGIEKIWAYRRLDDVNAAGIRTPEMYYIKAECLARAGKYADAMSALNTVRRKRIIPAFYTDVTASNLNDAIALIRREFKCEYRGTGMVYLDLRRFNNDLQFKATVTKKEGEVTYSITPESHIWIMPFSLNAMAHSEGLIQNSK